MPACVWWVKGANPVLSKLNRYPEAKPEIKDRTQGVGAGLQAAHLQEVDQEAHCRIVYVS